MLSLFRRKPKPIDPRQALDDMLSSAATVAETLAALAPDDRPVTVEELAKVEALVVGMVLSATKAQWADRGSSELMQIVFAPIEKAFRKAFHDRLFAVVAIDQSPAGQA